MSGLKGESLTDNMDEDDLADLDVIAPDVLDALLAKAKPNQDYIIKLKGESRIKPDVLEIIRDLFIDGQDVDALAILATELDMAPRPKRGIAWGFRSPTQIRPGQTFSWNSRPRDGWPVGRWQPRTLALSKETVDAFRIAKIFDLATVPNDAATHVLFEGAPLDGSTASFFGGYWGSFAVLTRALELKNPGNDELVINYYPGVGRNDLPIGCALPFPSPWGMPTGYASEFGNGGLSLTVFNRSERPAFFEGMVFGEVLDG